MHAKNRLVLSAHELLAHAVPAAAARLTLYQQVRVAWAL